MERNFRKRKKESGGMNTCKFCDSVIKYKEKYFCSSKRLKEVFFKGDGVIGKRQVEIDENFGCIFFESKELDTCDWCDGIGYYSCLGRDYLCEKCHGVGKIKMLDLADYENG